MLKFYAAKVLNDVIDRAMQVHGARGLTDETPLAHMALRARGARIYDGPDEVHRHGRRTADPEAIRRRRHMALRLSAAYDEAPARRRQRT